MKSKTPIRIKHMLQDLKKGLIPIYGNRLKGLYLYGSYARGDYRQGSDVDVMILLSNYNNYWEELRRSTELASEISLAYDLTLSRLIMDEQHWKESDMPVLRNIRKEGEPV